MGLDQPGVTASGGLTPAAVAMNRRLANMLTRFGMNGEKILADIAAAGAGAELLSDPTLVTPQGLIRLNNIGTMSVMLEMATGGKPTITPPSNPKDGLMAIVFFLKLNHTAEFGWRENDTPSAWARRIIDALFKSLAAKKVFTDTDFIALDRVCSNPLWTMMFSYSLELFLQAIADPAMVAQLDKATAGAAVNAFRASATARQARLPKIKYGNPIASFKDVAEYSIGEYLGGLNVNEALERALVQSQLGMSDDSGKQKFQAFLRDNQIKPETFPTTVADLYSSVQGQVRFQESEGEVAAVCYAYAAQTQQTQKVEKVFGAFADAIMPLAAKMRRHFHFGGISAKDGTMLIAGWARQSQILADLRSGGLPRQVRAVVAKMQKDERRALLAFRDGRTTAQALSAQEVDKYVKVRTKLLSLSAQQAKIGRVEDLLRKQINGAEQFIARPGQAALQDMTFGIDVFFRALRTVFDDICVGTGSLLRDQMKLIIEFQGKYGPLPTIALLCPMTPNMKIEDWLRTARDTLRKVDNDYFAAPDGF